MIFCTKYYCSVTDKWWGNYYIHAYSWEAAEKIAVKNELTITGEWVETHCYIGDNDELYLTTKFQLGQDEFMLWERPKPQRPE